MDTTNTIDRTIFANMVLNAASRLNAEKAGVDSLNVFPVPDGDTGTNMSLTMNSAAKFVSRLGEEGTVADVASQMAYGALMGARGNSGVILSQILGGFAQALENKTEIKAPDLAAGFSGGVAAAYKAVVKPMEGTILTVAREAGEYLAANVREDMSIEEALKLYLEEGYRSLARTPEILPVLKQAGVVDAGAKGLLIIAEGMLAAVGGDIQFALEAEESQPQQEFEDNHLVIDPDSIVFQYCTELFIKSYDGKTLDVEPIREYLAGLGDSLLVVGAGGMTKIHVHTNEPWNVIKYCVALGDLHEVKIENMREQNLRLKEHTPLSELAVIAVSAGEGLNEIFQGLGVNFVITGGQTMNPSTEDFMAAIEKVHAKEVIILPNNKNIILTAEQAAKISEQCQVFVVPSRSIPQGIAAMMAYNIEAPAEENVEAMSEALTQIRSIEITHAVRDTSIEDKEIKEGQILGIVDGKIKAVGDDMTQLVSEALASVGLDDYELVTLYYGADVTEKEATELMEKLAEKFPEIEFEVHLGDQAVYYYLLSVE